MPLLWLVVPTATQAAAFPGVGVGAIPDGGVCPSAGADLDVTFGVSGLTSPVADVDVAITLTHGWVGDLTVLLIGPDGFPHQVFGRTGEVQGPGCFGDSSDLAGTYVFDDSAPISPHWWDEADARGASEPLAEGSYLSSLSGGEGQTENPPLQTHFWGAFTGMPPEVANGTWILRIRDWASSFTGSVTAASLAINEDCESWILGGGSTTGMSGYAACGSILLVNHTVEGPSGELTLTSGSQIGLGDDFVVETGGRLHLVNDTGVNPLMAALEVSALLGDLDRLEAIEASGHSERNP